MRERWRITCVCIALACCGCRSALATQISVTVDTDLADLDAIRVRVLHGCTDGAMWLGTGDGRLAEGRATLPAVCQTLGDGRSVGEQMTVSDPITGLPAGALDYRLVSDRVFALPGVATSPSCDDVLSRLPLTLTVLPPRESPCRDRLPYLVVEAIGVPSSPDARAYYSARQATFVPGSARTLSVFLTECACRVGTTCDSFGRCVPVAETDVRDAGVGDAGPCAPGYADCDATPGCEARLGDDRANCGVCARACAGAEVCFEGSCTAAPCTGGERLCAGHCVSTDSDPDHCGTCDRACGAGQTCERGACTGGPPCPEGEDLCGTECVSLADTHQSRGCGVCDQDWDDCETDVPGCETPLGSLRACHGCAEDCAAAHMTTCDIVNEPGGCGFPCEPGWLSCPPRGIGCAVPSGTMTDCTGCGDDCNALHTLACTASGCGGGCALGWDDCDTSVPGCETPLGSLRACHGCEENCAAAHMTTCDIVNAPGGCGFPCEPGWLSCPPRGIGCAVPSGTMTDCTGCGDDCNALHTLACTPSGCGGGCVTGWANCDSAPDCETPGSCG